MVDFGGELFMRRTDRNEDEWDFLMDTCISIWWQQNEDAYTETLTYFQYFKNNNCYNRIVFIYQYIQNGDITKSK